MAISRHVAEIGLFRPRKVDLILALKDKKSNVLCILFSI